MSLNPLYTLLNQLDLIENKAVFFRDEGNGEIYKNFSADTKKKLNIIKPDAFFVFNHQPLVLFFDLTSNTDKDREAEIHKQVWSFDTSPIIFVIKDAEIKVYNALNYHKREGLKEIKLTEEERKENFSLWNLQSGGTFEWFYERNKKTVLKKRVNQQLFENIKQTILILKDKFGLEESLAKTIILRLIFIRYLIDRKIKIDNSFIEGGENEVIIRRKSLSNLIANPQKLSSFFNYLNDRFNGVLFKKSNIELTPNQAKVLSKLFNPDGVTAEDQINLFSSFDFQYEVFDFGIIPVELISGIYETLLDEDTKNATSAVYTPPFLVDYILTQTVDHFFKENPTISECKIFDPAMGSGIFLVQGLRRMIERELSINPNVDNETFGNNIRGIAERNLFGIDINQEAIDVACFSIYVALLDYQEPGNIDQYIFPNLSDKNFFKTHFFDLKEKASLDLDKIKAAKIDFILGNPPWKNNSSPEHLDWLKQTKFDKIVSDKQIAQSYLIRVKDFVQEHTKIALIVTSKVYYNNKAQKFKKYFLENNILSEIFDLSPVRHIVFENANSPAAILFFQNTVNQENNALQAIVKHISIKQNKYFNQFSKNLVIEKFDQKQITQKYFFEHDWMFKMALYGNTLDYMLFTKLEKEHESIEKLLFDNLIEAKNGIHKGTPKKSFDDLVGLPIIETSSIRRYFTSILFDTNVMSEEDVFLEAGRTIEAFKGKKILLTRSPKNETDINLSLCLEDCVFRNSVYGIPIEDDEVIAKLYSLLMSKIYTYYLYLTSSNWGVYYPIINMTEYLSFPYIEPTETQKERVISLVNNLLKPYKEFYQQNPNMLFQGEPNKKTLDEINSIIEEIYEIKPYEKDLINYVLDVSRYQFQESKQHLFSKKVHTDKAFLEKYAEVYFQEFEEIYDDEFMQVEIYPLNHFIALNFVFLKIKPTKKIIYPDKKDAKEVLKSLANLSIAQITSMDDLENNLFIQKDVKGFEENSFFIIKPNELKCWHRAMAWYDVAEFKEAIQKSELERIHSRFSQE